MLFYLFLFSYGIISEISDKEISIEPLTHPHLALYTRKKNKLAIKTVKSIKKIPHHLYNLIPNHNKYMIQSSYNKKFLTKKYACSHKLLFKPIKNNKSNRFLWEIEKKLDYFVIKRKNHCLSIYKSKKNKLKVKLKKCTHKENQCFKFNFYNGGNNVILKEPTNNLRIYL